MIIDGFTKQSVDILEIESSIGNLFEDFRSRHISRHEKFRNRYESTAMHGRDGNFASLLIF
mgnify:CR=1 FL=1|jgi:hypothetical protein